MSWLFRPLASLKLTVILLLFSMVLVFLGTMAQEPLGLYLAQARFFQSAFVDLAAMTAAVKKSLQMVHVYLPPSTAADVMTAPFIPVFPGGYLLGSLLLVNLIAAHFSRFQVSRKKAGILLVHFGMILLLVGQLMTDLVARESAMRLTEGQTKSYSEADRLSELAVADVTSPEKDRVFAFPDSHLASGAVLEHAELPFKLRVTQYYPNSFLTNRVAVPNAPAVSDGPGTRFAPIPLPKVTVMDMRDVPSAFVEVTGPEGVVGSYLLTEFIERPQAFRYKDRAYELSLRLRRYYKDFSLTLLDFRHDKYQGTEIPKNFSSDVQLRNLVSGEDRTVKIYMNNPLRYQGFTFYQASFDPRDERVTILQVVKNPAWLTPYFACVIVGLGLTLQFGIHLVGFVRKRSAATAGTPNPAAA